MRALLQRVSRAAVRVDQEVVGSVDQGLLVLLGVGPDDGPAQVAWMAEKVATLRVFEDGEGKMNRSVEDIGGGLLVVSQFTLFADVRKGRRPSFVGAAKPEVAVPLYEGLVQALRDRGLQVATGRFGADMAVELVNQGPVTLWIETP